MKNIAIIFAGGTGSRMEYTDKPKQFLTLDGKPIIIHTIDKFENCKMIDGIAIACKEEFIEVMKELLKEFNIQKVEWIVPGGETTQLSVYNALNAVKNDKRVFDDSIVLIHDGVRPAIDNQLILENIVTTRTHGSSITVVNAFETILVSEDEVTIDNVLNRENVFYARAPQCFYLNDLYKVHVEEKEAGSVNNIDSCSMMNKKGFSINFVKGKSSNIKITTYEDYYIYKAIYELEQRRKQEVILT